MTEEIEQTKSKIITKINLLNLQKQIINEKIEELMVEEVNIVNEINELMLQYQLLK